MPFPEIPPSSLSLLELEWRDGELPDTQEALVPNGCDPFIVAKILREGDPSAAYACVERDTGATDGPAWYVVAMPDDPPSGQRSDPKSKPFDPISPEPPEPHLWKCRVIMTPTRAPQYRAEFFVYDTTENELHRKCRRLAMIAPAVFSVTHNAVECVRDGVAGAEPGAFDDAANQLRVIQAVAGLASYLRWVYPRDVPDNAELARQLARVFASEGAGDGK